jgi:predicted permease
MSKACLRHDAGEGWGEETGAPRGVHGMTAVLDTVLPVFVLIALGYGAVQRRFITDEGLRAMTLFVFVVASPALLFSGGTRPHEGGGGAALALIAGALLIYGLAVAGARRWGGMDMAVAALFGLACVFGNTVMMGIPIILAAYGQAGLPALLAILAVQSLALLGTATVLTEIGLNARAPWKRLLLASLQGIGRNPVVLAVIAAFVWTILGLPVPGALRATLDLVGAAASPLALFCLGGSLVGLSAVGAWRETAVIAALKLVAQPLLVFALARLLRLPPAEAAVAVTIAALPTGANAFILARRYATGADRSGGAVVLTTALSVLTLSALIAWFRGTLP